MKGIQFVLVLCLIASLYCSKAIMFCALDKLPASTCDNFVNLYKENQMRAISFIMSKKTELFNALKSCL